MSELTFTIPSNWNEMRIDSLFDIQQGKQVGLELLSTVHWVLKNDSVHSLDDVIRHTYGWNERKRQFTPRQIALAMDVLVNKGWVPKPETREN